MIKSKPYEGIEPLYLMVIKNPKLWNEPIAIETIGVIWEKLNIKSKKCKLTDDEWAITQVCPEAFAEYVKLIDLYNSYSGDEKDLLCKEWNQQVTLAILKSEEL